MLISIILGLSLYKSFQDISIFLITYIGLVLLIKVPNTIRSFCVMHYKLTMDSNYALDFFQGKI